VLAGLRVHLLIGLCRTKSVADLFAVIARAMVACTTPRLHPSGTAKPMFIY